MDETRGVRGSTSVPITERDVRNRYGDASSWRPRQPPKFHPTFNSGWGVVIRWVRDLRMSKNCLIESFGAILIETKSGLALVGPNYILWDHVVSICRIMPPRDTSNECNAGRPKLVSPATRIVHDQSTSA